MSLRNKFREETPQNLTPKFVKDMAGDVLENNKTSEMFQAMVLIKLKMGILGLEVQSLKTKLTTMEGGKKIYLGKWRRSMKAMRNIRSEWVVGRNIKYKLMRD